MEGPPEAEGKRDPRTIMQAVLIAALIVGVGIISYAVYANSPGKGTNTGPAIKSGDLVTMDYIGRLADGRVFDTSLLNVARDNGLYPKSLTFSLRSNSSYIPFNMTAGNYGSSGGTIKGFALGVIGLHEGDHAVIDVKPGDGYAVNPGNIRTVTLVQELPIYDVIPVDQFRLTFNAEPVPMHTYPHFFWKWDVLVVAEDPTSVLVKQIPAVGQVVYPFGDPNNQANPLGWPVVVESYDLAANGGNGLITVRHELAPSQAGHVEGTDIDGQAFILTGVNTTDGTFELHRSDAATNYNAELAGVELFFEVTIEKVLSI